MKKGGLKKLLAMFLVLAAVIPLGTVTAAAAGETSAGQTAATISTGSLTADEFRAEVVRLVNIERENAGADALSIMDKLIELADVRAAESAASFSHTRPDGRRCFTVFADYSIIYRAAGENLSLGYTTPEAVVKAWMDSPSHKKNILDPDFKYIGIGFYVNNSGTIYCSQLFYTPKS